MLHTALVRRRVLHGGLKFSVVLSPKFMACSRRSLISRFLTRQRTKCLSLVLFSITLYVFGGFIKLSGDDHHIHFIDYSRRITEGNEDFLVNLYETTRAAKEKDFNEESLDNEAPHITAVVSENVEIRNTAANQSRTSQRPRRKFVFVFRYYEQLGRGASNLLALASFAKNKNRLVVLPFVNNSRMSGLPNGVSHHFRKSDFPFLKKYGQLSDYFDVNDLNDRLTSYGYSTFESFPVFESQCAKRLNIVVHFLFDDDSSKRETGPWYRLTSKEVEQLYKQAKQNNGWADCPVVKHSRLSRQLGFKVSRYVCVDPEIIRTASDLEDKILQGAMCVGIVQWKGNGQERVHFPLDPSISQPLYPSDFEFNPHLVKIAKDFVRSKFHGKFIGIHVRSERHIIRKGYNVTMRCMQKLANRVHESQSSYPAEGVFLATDLSDYGSDTLKDRAESNDRRSLSRFLHEALKYPITFDPRGLLYDSGAVAIVELNILSLATRIFTLGSGNFQQWVIDLFLKRHGHEKQRVHQMCQDS